MSREMLGQEARAAVEELLDRAATIPNLPPERAQALVAARDALQGRGLTVALDGAFQSGKSTTFNLVCGAEICPRGKGIRTSAVAVEAAQASSPEEVGTATVAWKTEEELLAPLREVFPQYADWSLGRWAECYDDAEAFEALRAKVPREQAETLRVAELILSHRASSHLARLRATARFPLADVRGFMAFPERWEERWAGRQRFAAVPFTDRESVFAFVKRISCRVDAPFLRETGITLVDCPGQDASGYDEAVAMEALRGADAVWHLLGGGEKDVSAAEIAHLRALVEKGGKRLRDVFLSLNVKGETWRTWLPSAVARLNNAHVFEGRVRVGDVVPYHAALALAGEALGRLRADELPEAARERLCAWRRCEPDELEDELCGAIENGLETMGAPEPEDDAALSALAETWSRLTELRDAWVDFRDVREVGFLFSEHCLGALVTALREVPVGQSVWTFKLFGAVENPRPLERNERDSVRYKADCERFGEPPAEWGTPEDRERFLDGLESGKVTSPSYWGKVMVCRARNEAERTFEGVLYPTLKAAGEARAHAAALDGCLRLPLTLEEKGDACAAALEAFVCPPGPSAERVARFRERYDAACRAFGVQWPSIAARDRAARALRRARWVAVVASGLLSGGLVNGALRLAFPRVWCGVVAVTLLAAWWIGGVRAHPVAVMGTLATLNLGAAAYVCLTSRGRGAQGAWVDAHRVPRKAGWYWYALAWHAVGAPMVAAVATLAWIGLAAWRPGRLWAGFAIASAAVWALSRLCRGGFRLSGQRQKWGL